MLIKSVELKNVKSYSHETIEFVEGINGICGQNGHGKSTILESIGYVLFDYPPYKKIDDFRRHGEKSGYVAVTVEGKDEIDYTIFRKLGGSDYYIKTPVSEIKGKKDVTDWIASNLLNNVRSSGDMPSIFENAVGVPQGTFTTAFLLNPEPRKKIFDNILRVEEYKTAFTNLREVLAAVEKTIDSMDRELIPLRTRTENYPGLEQEKEKLQLEIDELKVDIKEINTKISELTLKKEELAGKKSQLDTLSSRIKSERVRLEEVIKQLERANSDLKRAESSRNTVNELLPVEESYKKQNHDLAELNGDRVKRDKLKDDISRLNLKINSLLEKLERSANLAMENNDLEEKKKLLLPKIEEMRRLEEAIRELQKELKEPMNEIISSLLNLREKSKRMEDIRHEIEGQKSRLSALLPLRNKQLEIETKIKDMKNNLELPLRELSSEVSALKQKESQAEKLQNEIMNLTSRKNQLLPELERYKALDSEIKTLSAFQDSLGRLGFELRRLVERDERANALLSEIERLEKSIVELRPLVEQQVSLEKQKSELEKQHASVNSLLKQTRSNMKLAGTRGLCPILNGVKCNSVADFTRYFNNEIDSRKKDLTDIENKLDLISKELKNLSNPAKQHEDMLVLVEAKKEELSALACVHDEVVSCRLRIESLASSYPSIGIDIRTGDEDELKAVSMKLQSHKQELEKINRSIAEFESTEALIASKNKDLKDLSDVPSALFECAERIKRINSIFGINVDIENIKAGLEKAIHEIRTLELYLTEMNDPAGQITTIESLIVSKQKDLNSLKDVPVMISTCLKQLDELNKRFALKDVLEGNPLELKIADELIESKTRELKALNSPDKEFENLNRNIEKNLEELKILEHVPVSLESCRHERESLESKFLFFSGLDKKIAAVQEMIKNLEPQHDKYLQALPLALKMDEYAQECRYLQDSISSVNSALNEDIQKQGALLEVFNEQLLDETIHHLEVLGNSASSSAEALKGRKRNMDKLARDLAIMETEFLKIKDIEKKLDNEKQFLSFSTFIRDTIKNSSEYIVNEFIGEISQDAGNIYSEIMDDYTCGLKWQNDYDIEIESAGEVKSFRQLSGGERMSAALAVRLALLKALSSCDFVFLDEPTQNMDEIRREKLSQEIMNIRGFKQVFVISHDDTFNEKYANVIKIEKTDGESRVVSCST
ncbi:MAG: AAA family ATPase [Candidatus Methanoperedenaceae archaeon]|nr:AAA family ATPase [Candidatus Methanoperedenaceae archaeon]